MWGWHDTVKMAFRQCSSIDSFVSESSGRLLRRIVSLGGVGEEEGRIDIGEE